MNVIKRVIIIVLDSVGVGELPDADLYGDKGSNTVGNIAKALGGINLHWLEKYGLGNIIPVEGVPPSAYPMSSYGKMAEKSKGKDTTTGHWEIAGLILDKPFPTYPNGFPQDIIASFEKAIGKKVIGNKPASGTEIIKELGEEHIKTGYPIVYTSADSVFQIAAHEEVIPVEELYRLCEIAYEILVSKQAIGRVIARPFLGKKGNFYRTPRRHDFSVKPFNKTMLDYLLEKGIKVYAVGKIYDIFAGQGISEYVTTKNNMEGVDKTLEFMEKYKEGLIFTNLVDFDMLYGHRNDVLGYYKALQEFDSRLPEFEKSLTDEDILIITADHGCDPTTPSTDHSREYAPLLVRSKQVYPGVNLGLRKSFTDIAATVGEVFSLPKFTEGESFLKELYQQKV